MAIDPGPECEIKEIWITDTEGNRLAGAMPGDIFEIHVSYVAVDRALHVANNTRMVITIIDETGAVKNWEDALLEWPGVNSNNTNFHCGKMGNNVMPNYPIKLFPRMWFHDDRNPTPNVPPVSEW